jgi:hypothetical protein
MLETIADHAGGRILEQIREQAEIPIWITFTSESFCDGGKIRGVVEGQLWGQVGSELRGHIADQLVGRDIVDDWSLVLEKIQAQIKEAG